MSRVAEIFLSKARSMEAQARAVAEALRASGYAVCMDDALPAHRAYRDVIPEQLAAANAVVVVWSADAVRSQWVRSEANYARESGKLVQLTVDDAPLLMPFGEIQCAELRGWAGDTNTAGWRKVADSVAELVGAAESGAPVGAPGSQFVHGHAETAARSLSNSTTASSGVLSRARGRWAALATASIVLALVVAWLLSPHAADRVGTATATATSAPGAARNEPAGAIPGVAERHEV